MKKYQIKNAKDRADTDLTKYAADIETAVKQIVGKTLVPNSLHVDKKYFEFDADYSDAVSRQLGKEIAAASPDLNKLVKEYQYTRSDGSPAVSHQLFERF